MERLFLYTCNFIENYVFNSYCVFGERKTQFLIKKANNKWNSLIFFLSAYKRQGTIVRTNRLPGCKLRPRQRRSVLGTGIRFPSTYLPLRPVVCVLGNQNIGIHVISHDVKLAFNGSTPFTTARWRRRGKISVTHS